MIRLKRLYVNTASSFCMLVIRKFLLSTEHTEDTEIFVKDSRCQQNFYYPRNTHRTSEMTCLTRAKIDVTKFQYCAEKINFQQFWHTICYTYISLESRP